MSKELEAQEKREVSPDSELTRPQPVFQPAVDIYESEKGLTLIADMPGDQGGQFRIGGQQPAALGDPVGLVGEAPRVHLMETAELSFLQQAAVQRGNTIDRVGTDDGEMCHADPLFGSLLDQRHAAQALGLAHKADGNVFQEAPVDFIHYLKMPR